MSLKPTTRALISAASQRRSMILHKALGSKNPNKAHTLSTMRKKAASVVNDSRKRLQKTR